MLYRF
jgi:hypothetical protein